MVAAFGVRCRVVIETQRKPGHRSHAVSGQDQQHRHRDESPRGTRGVVFGQEGLALISPWKLVLSGAQSPTPHLLSPNDLRSDRELQLASILSV
jgi:hypothetical protein